MAETKIGWADYTFNPWRGCTKIAEGCKFCYAGAMSKRNPGTLGVWGPNGKRVVAAESYWREPEKWDRQAAKDGVRRKVFCASLADVFEDWRGRMSDVHDRTLFYRGGKFVQPAVSDSSANPITMQDVRGRVFILIDKTPNLDWLLLTKRVENVERMVPWKHDPWPPNLWVGYSASTQEDLDRGLPHLLKVPAAVRFLSLEPLLGPMDFANVTNRSDSVERCGKKALDGIGWVIVGGESGPNARPMHPDWVRSIRDQCVAAGVPFFFKQWGAWLPGEKTPDSGTAYRRCDTWEIYGVPARANYRRDNFGTHPDIHSGSMITLRVGKKSAGRLLDGREWSEVPSAL